MAKLSPRRRAQHSLAHSRPIKLYHGTSVKAARKIRNGGLKSSRYGIEPYGESSRLDKSLYTHQTLTSSKKYAKMNAEHTLIKSKRVRQKKKYNKIRRGAIVTVILPRKVSQQYLIRGIDESGYFAGDKRGREYGLHKPIPKKYLR